MVIYDCEASRLYTDSFNVEKLKTVATEFLSSSFKQQILLILNVLMLNIILLVCLCISFIKYMQAHKFLLIVIPLDIIRVADLHIIGGKQYMLLHYT